MVSSLPTEILMAIFAALCISDPPYTLQTSPALTLSHVCASWRSLALSMPELWAGFIVKLPQSYVCEQSTQELLHMHMQRSGNHPLTLDVDFGTSEAKALYSLLVEQSNRWRQVRIPLSEASVPHLAPLRDRLALLERLHLRLDGTIGYRGEQHNYFVSAPKLRELTLASSLPFHLPFPTQQLTHLRLGATVTLDAFSFLEQRSWPCLETLVLNPFYPFKLPPNPRPLSPFPRLHTLVLAIRDGYSRNPILDVLCILEAPALKHMHCYGLREVILPHRAFTAFVERSACAIISLQITFRDNLPVASLLANLRTLSDTLTHLVVFALGTDAMSVTATILTALVATDAVCLLPSLISLEFQSASFNEALLDMAESRIVSTDSCTRLERLILHNTPSSDASNIWQRLTALAASGIALSWLPRHKPAKSSVFIQ
ncbi:F-box domain-containing protein [Mycena kentingensis (nom. inval.)]|nr:F-box domain-containing protein [Mycena kentingensis (nom. inval.)]